MLRAHKILLVEDNENDEILTLRAISRASFHCEVEVARDGLDAWEYLKKNESPDLAILDLQLPRMNGLEVLRGIRSSERLHELPVVVLSSSDQIADVAACYHSGATSYVRKPVDADAYMERVQRIVDYWLNTHEPHPLLKRPAVLG